MSDRREEPKDDGLSVLQHSIPRPEREAFIDRHGELFHAMPPGGARKLVMVDAEQYEKAKATITDLRAQLAASRERVGELENQYTKLHRINSIKDRYLTQTQQAEVATVYATLYADAKGTPHQ